MYYKKRPGKLNVCFVGDVLYLNGRINRDYIAQRCLQQIQAVYCLLFMAMVYKNRENSKQTNHLGSSSIVTKGDVNIEKLTDYRFTGKKQDYSKLYLDIGCDPRLRPKNPYYYNIEKGIFEGYENQIKVGFDE